ncbi:MAG: hypothetical protein ACLSCR_08525 [Akkermansia sp.]
MPDKLSVGVGGGNAQRAEGRRPQGIDLGMFGRQPEYAPEAQEMNRSSRASITASPVYP